MSVRNERGLPRIGIGYGPIEDVVDSWYWYVTVDGWTYDEGVCWSENDAVLAVDRVTADAERQCEKVTS